MFEFLANTFGYILNFIYNIVNNYGLAIILFTILVKLLLLPLSIKQHKTMKKSAKLQEQMKSIQFKYKNDPEKMNQEIMNLYKTEHMSPFSGCLSTIIQMILIISLFFLIKSPLTFMRKVSQDTLNTYVTEIQEKAKEDSKDENSQTAYTEIDIIREKGAENEEVRINMEFLGLDLGEVPQQNMQDWKVWIIPVLYIISSYVSIRLTTSMQQKQKNKPKKDDVIDITEDGENKENQIAKVENDSPDPAAQTGKMMAWLMPIMAISIAFIAPLGLALYWFINNILMIAERIVLDKVIKTEEE